MPLCSKHCNREGRRALGALLPEDAQGRSSRCLAIGLINNMPDAALEATERQFRALLGAASEGMSVRLSLYALPGVPRSEAGRRHIEKSYASLETLWDAELDALIVTGAEPRMASLKDEPYWESFTGVLEWARENTRSTIFSCLAAHAALLHMDGIGRIRSGEKHFGVFDCARLGDHRLTAGMAPCFHVPHSRWNGISEAELAASGYNVLTRSAEGGVDTFVKQHKALFVFFQGHPEYDSDSLLREYRRDVSRYLKGETDHYPSVPQNYFDANTADALMALREQAMSSRSEQLLSYVSTTLEHGTIENTWHATAACIYRNWLQYIREQKENRSLLTNIDLMANPAGVGIPPARHEVFQLDRLTT